MNIELINQRIEMLDLAERLAMEDNNPKNYDENMAMVARCIAGKIELMNIRQQFNLAA